MTHEYMDEKILKMVAEIKENEEEQAKEAILAKEAAEQNIAGGQSEVYGETINFAPREFLAGKLHITIPCNWIDMEADLVKMKYPYESRPAIILTDDTMTINLTVNHTKHALTPEQVGFFVQDMKMLTDKSMKIQFMEDGLIQNEASGSPIGWYDFTISAIDEALYNLMIVTSLDNRALIMSFNCLAKDLARWKPIAFDMMKTIELNVNNRPGMDQTEA